jgi:hypothetical protein
MPICRCHIFLILLAIASHASAEEEGGPRLHGDALRTNPSALEQIRQTENQRRPSPLAKGMENAGRQFPSQAQGTAVRKGGDGPVSPRLPRHSGGTDAAPPQEAPYGFRYKLRDSN